MSNQVSEQIDIYTKGNLRELKQEEAKTGRKFTKYDIAQKMLSEGKLSESDFAQWMNTSEGYESSVLTSQQKQALMQGSVWTLNQNNESYLDEFDTYIKDPLTGVKLKGVEKQSKKTNISSELANDIEIRENVVDLVLNNAQTALSMIESYHDSIGYISADAFVQGMNVLGNVSWDLLTGRQDFVTVFEQEKGLAQEIETLKKLKNKTKSPMEFAKEFKKLYGVEFKPENFKRLSEVSRQLNELNAYSGLDKYFAFGIEKLKDADMNSLDPAAYLAPVFGNNPIKAQEYINELKSECKNDEELREKLTSILVESKKETESKLALLEHNRSRLESEFKSAYKSAMGDYKSDEIIEGYINIQRMNAMGTEVAGTIALSMFTMGSSAVMKMSSKVISKMGVKAGSQLVKAGMTGTMAAVPAAETVVGGLTSKSGMTLEKGGQAWEELKNGLMYGAFGAYISGPLGNVVSKVLSKNPQIFSQLVASQKFSLGAGAVAETSADVLFDRITSDLSFKESLAQNGIMNFGMMFVGARMHKGMQLPDADLSQIKIEKMRDGSFNLKANGKVFFKAKNADELAVATLVLGVKEATAENPAQNVTPRFENEVYKNEFKDEGMRLYTPEKLENELRAAEANPKAPAENTEALTMVASGKTKQLMTQRYSEMAKNLDEIHTKYAKEIRQMEAQYGKEPQLFAGHFMKFLAEKMEVAGCEPNIKFVKTEGDGAYDWRVGTLYLSDNLQNTGDIKTMIAHEFIHTLQFRNILATYGRDGVIELYMKHKDGKAIDELTRKYVKDEYGAELEDLGLSNAEVTKLQRQVAEAYADRCLSYEANARLLKHAQENPVEKGSVDSYMARLQLDNLIKPEEFDTEAYYRSTNETEAYFLGNGQITGRSSKGETIQKTSGSRCESNTRISIPHGKIAASATENVLETLRQLGASEQQIDNFKKNTSDEVISYIESRISAPDFNPSTENYFIHLNQNNISFIKELAADPNFPKEQLSLVANAAYSQNFVIQISNAYKKGINIIPGCMKIAQMKAALEARMKDPAVIASQKAYEDAIQRIKENCSLTDAEIREISRDINIRETAIQDLIIYCEKNGIKNYHSILYNCSINREGINLSSKEIEERVKFAKRGLENKVDPGEMSSMVYQYGKYSPSEMEAQLNKVIEETRIANEKRLAKETAIANKKDSLRKKYNTTEAKDIVERIINKENLPEDLLTHLDEILGENPNSAKCRFLEKCVSEIKPEKFNLGLFKTNFEAGLKKADISSISLNAKWQPRPEAKNVILTPEYLSALKDKDGKPIFNNLAVENIIEKSKTNPDLVKEIVDMAIENRSLRAPAVLKPLLEAAFIDKNLAFSVLSMKKNNGEPRFNTLELSIVLDSFKSKLPLVKEIFNLEKLYNMDINPSRVILQTNSTEDIRTAFSYQYCRMLNDIKKDNGSPMYHPFYDIREGIQQALIDNPEVTLHYLNKNVPNDRTAYNGTVIRALNNIAKKCPELEMVFRQRLEFIKNDESHTQRDKMLGTIKALAEVNNFDNALKIYEHASELGIDNHINTILEKADSIPYNKLVYLKDTLGRERISQMSAGELSFAIEFAHLAKVSNINEIPMENKKTFLRDLVASNSDLFKISDELAKDFPILPRNQEQYCELLPSLVRSLGIETVQLSPEKVETFKKSIDDLSQSIAKISDSEFANLHISQEFTKDDFVNVVLEKVKDLPQTERQKVFDYFGFDIIKNDGNKTTGYSITGYPVNLNNGKKLAQITDPKTQAVVENLKPDVIKFSQNNPIKCDNPAVEKLLNEIAEVLPEIRTMIGKTQHATHSFDVMQHSLKVMQKISQDPKFKTLNESDQKIMLLASLLHDITKREGFSDKTHASNGSFDAFYIAKKFNLTREEEIKLYSIARHHEWLEFVNTSRNEAELTKRLQSVAFDLQQDNLFDMTLMFTHADLKAVKSDNTFHDSTTGRINPKFNGEERVFNDNQGTQISLGQSADIYAKRIKTYINELKKSIPLTPVTQVPTSDVIRTHIKQINPDGSTEHKGVYVDSDGLIVIKFNEVTDWEALGFPKGTTTSGVTGTGRVRREKILESEFNTGNFKFFAHALNYSNQLVKFDSFGLPDSDALLSVTYMERPESKHRNYRTQGIGLNIKSKYVYGGGETDAGSGCSKNIAEFKENYIFGGRREGDRVFTANLIKKATGMSDEQYIEFVEKNQNKSWNEVEPIDNSDPVEFRNKLIKAFAENIVSNQRAQKRAYDEFYASNPEAPMFTWAYSADANEKIKNPLEFLHRNELTQVEKNIKQIGEVELTPVAERTEFLRQYSLERDIPMFIFGD